MAGDPAIEPLRRSTPSATVNTGRGVLLDTSRGLRPGLLVSVRNREEALLAVKGGADVIDVKEPTNGPLGMADRTDIEAIRCAIHDCPVTCALGELVDLPDQRAPEWVNSLGIAAVKSGLAGAAKKDWTQMLEKFAESVAAETECVAVAYADHAAANAPHPEEVIREALRQGIRWVLIDTWNKRPGASVLRLIAKEDLAAWIGHCQDRDVGIVLAGGLRELEIPLAAALRPSLVAVRGAACSGVRAGNVSERLVSQLREKVELATRGVDCHDHAQTA